MQNSEDPLVETWIDDHLDKDAKIGVDQWCMSIDTSHIWKQPFLKKGQNLIQLERKYQTKNNGLRYILSRSEEITTLHMKLLDL